MKHRMLSLSFLALMACSSVAETPISPCTELKLPCIASENMAVIGTMEAQSELLNQALSAANKFETAFGIKPGKTMIVPGGVITAAQRQSFSEAGYHVTLPWISAADKAKLRESHIRQQIEEQTKGLPEAIQNSAIKQALAAIKSGVTDDQAGQIQAGAFTHELGHLWFMDAFKPAETEAQTGHGYGGWAPDWLDETAAVLMENKILREKRREAFFAIDFTDTIPLREFLTKEHPGAKSARDLVKTSSGDVGEGEARAIVLTGEEAKAFLKASGGARAADFYAQTQVFSDYLLAAKQDRRLFVSLTGHLRDGGAFESWLKAEGPRWGLPPDLDSLEKDWANWVKTQR